MVIIVLFAASVNRKKAGNRLIETLFPKAAMVSVFGQTGKGGVQFFFEIRLIAAVIRIEILLVNHDVDVFAVVKRLQLGKNLFFGVIVQYNID